MYILFAQPYRKKMKISASHAKFPTALKFHLSDELLAFQSRVSRKFSEES